MKNQEDFHRREMRKSGSGSSGARQGEKKTQTQESAGHVWEVLGAQSVMTEAWDAGGGVEGGRVTIKKLKGQ